jgi:low density lipoprotein receptor-related protein 5/6
MKATTLNKHRPIALGALIFAAVTMITLGGCGKAATPDTSPTFGNNTVPAAFQNAVLPVLIQIPRITLPEASGGDGELSYSLTSVPGLSFDPETRVISGMPNTVGSYEISYKATDEDGDAATLTADIVVIHTKVFWTDIGRATITSANLDGTDVKILFTGDPAAEVHGIALDVPANKMYWTEYAGRIRRANLDGSGEESLVVEENTRPRSIALDLKRGKMYWTDNGKNSIRRANLDGTGVEDLVTGLSYPTAIALDVVGEMIYWIDDAADRIQRANLNGSDVEDIKVSDLAAPYGLAVDSINQKVYWAHRRTGWITRANLDGTAVENIVLDGSAGEPNELVLNQFNGKMYWTDMGGSGSVRSANSSDGTSIEVLASGFHEPYGIALH